MGRELVKDWMSAEVITISPDNSLAEAEAIMIDNVIRHLPVTGADGRLQGMVTYGDIRRILPSASPKLRTAAQVNQAAQLPVSDFMTKGVRAINRDASIGEAAQVMLNHMIGCLPVVDQYGFPVGIITSSDIFRLVIREWAASGEKDLHLFITAE